MTDEQIEQLARENERLRRVLIRILDEYPYVHCRCGRKKDKIKDDVRVEASELVKPEAE